jgi:hypothetical protein
VPTPTVLLAARVWRRAGLDRHPDVCGSGSSSAGADGAPPPWLWLERLLDTP